MLRNANYIYDNVIIEDGEHTTKLFCKKAQVGVDLSLRGVKKIISPGVIFTTKSAVSKYEDMDISAIYRTDEGEIIGGFYLPQGTYIAILNEGCAFGPNDTGRIILRSSLNRCGVSIESAVWDPGYTSKEGENVYPMSIRITVDTEQGIYIEKGARVAQLLVFENEDTDLYDGQFQGGHLQSKLIK